MGEGEMAFAYVVSLKREIERYLTDHDSPLDPEILELAYKHADFAEEIAKRVFISSGERRLLTEMHKLVYELDYALDSFVEEQKSKRFFLFGRSSNTIFRLQKRLFGRGEANDNLEQQIHLFAENMKKLEQENGDELYHSLPLEDDDDDDDDDDESMKMVGLSDHYNHLKQMLLGCTWLFQIISLFGMPGIGKTTLAREIFKDRDILQHFDCRVWVTLTRNCRSKQVPRKILAALLMNLGSDKDEDDGDIALRLNECLRGKRYLIVLDNVWDRYMSECLQASLYSRRGKKLTNHFPDEKNGSRILITSRLRQVEHVFANETIQVRLMDEEESWDLLREKVFARDEPCPFHLERIGRKIAEKCEGLPLTIIAVATLLSETDKTAEFWNEVATRKRHQVFKAAYDQISKVLLPSFIYLPRPLQMCFMFMGVFPLKYEVPRSKLINLWNCDGFLEPFLDKFTYEAAIVCVEELASNSMVMICKNTITGSWGLDSKAIKTCRLHSSLWHLSNREARQSKFSHVLDSCDDGLGDDIKGQHRLSFHNNVLFGIKEVNRSVEENCASTAHSVLCYGPYLPYQVPLCFGLRLLRELDALTVRFYEFPMEVVELVELEYLALIFNGELPTAISRLSKLRFLIVDRHLSIIDLCGGDDGSSPSCSYLPMEIWSMKELQHLQVRGSDLPNPCGALLHGLLTLSSVDPKSCTEAVFRAIPCLKKLGIRIELSPDLINDGDLSPLRSCLSHVSLLWGLLSLKCVVVNPYKATRVSAPVAPVSTLPSSLRKLSLSGMGYEWEEMSKIASLRYLKVLKLRNCAFQGAVWEVRKGELPSLESLVIEDTDLVKWKIGGGSLFWLKWLIMKRCHKLKVIDGEFGEGVEEIEMVDCNPLGVEQMKKATMREVRVSCSWFDVKPKV